jgi:hypothetical protein
MGEIARAHGAALRESCVLTAGQHKVLRAIARCRTSALGGHLHVCEQCGYSVPMYNSCRNRHCPSCQAVDQHRWLEERSARILPTEYFHVVFTLPDTLRAWVRANPAALFTILFHAAADTLLTLARDPKWLGAVPAITTVLHTWTRELLFHPHVHAIVSAGGLSLDGEQWIASKSDGRFLFPVKILGTVFRAKFRDALLAAFADGAIEAPRDLPPDALDQLRDAFSRKAWIVYAKRPFGGADQVFAYLGRYTHRVGISNSRIQSMDERGVRFGTKDSRTITLPGVEFLRRFLDHVLPFRFTKIRHYGLLAPCHATTTLERARALIAPSVSVAVPPSTSAETTPQSWVEVLLAVAGIDPFACPRCHIGRLVIRPLAEHCAPRAPDTS